MPARKTVRPHWFDTNKKSVIIRTDAASPDVEIKDKDITRLLFAMVRVMDRGDLECMKGYVLMYESGQLSIKPRKNGPRHRR